MRNSTASRTDGTDFSFRADEFVVGAGEPIGFQVESDIDSRKIDHVWVTIRAGRFGPLRISINTYSLRHAADGFDPRMRVGVLTSRWSQLPASGIFPVAGLDYAELERAQVVAFREMEGQPETMLKERRIKRFSWKHGARSIDGTGSGFIRCTAGARVVACALITGRDGALRFYYREGFCCGDVSLQILRQV